MGFSGSGSGGGSIAGSSDAALNNPINNDVLTYDSSTSKWKNAVSSASVTKAQVGLGNVDNTSDVNKPISTAQQTALDTKAPLIGSTVTVHGNVARPTARTDVSVIWIHSSQPDDMNLNADIWLNIEG